MTLHISKSTAVVMAITAGFFWGTNPIFAKLVDGLTPLGLAVGRMIFGMIFISLGIVMVGRWSEVVRSAHDWRYWMGFGLLMAVHWTLIMVGFRTTLAGNAAMLGNTTPFFLMLLNPFFLKETLTWRDIFWAVFIFCGIVLMMFGKGTSFEFSRISGDLASLGAAFLFAVYTLFVRRDQRYPFYVMIFWLFVMSGFFMVLGGFFFQISFFDGPAQWNSSMVYLVLMGLLGTTVGHSAYNFSLKGLRSDQASLLALMSPATSLVLGYFVLEEQFTVWGLMGLMITLFGIAAILQSHLETRRWMFWRRKNPTLPSGV